MLSPNVNCHDISNELCKNSSKDCQHKLNTLCNIAPSHPHYQFLKLVANPHWKLGTTRGIRGKAYTQIVTGEREKHSRSRTPWTRRVVGSSRPRLELDTCGDGPSGEAPRRREASKRSSATAGRSRRTGHHRATSRTARCPRPRAAFRRAARARRGAADGAPAAAASSSDTVMEMLRIVDDGIGGEALVGEVVGWAFTLWARTRVTLSWASLVVDRGHVPEPWTHHLAHIGLSTSPGWLGLANRTER